MIKAASTFFFFILYGVSHAGPAKTPAGSIGFENTGAYYSNCLSSKEMELFKLINEYRIKNGLPPVRVSRSLSTVARIHAADLSVNKPHELVDFDGSACTLHSWSDKGNWSSGCYTDDNRHAEIMWNKPREITCNLYTGNGYENAYLTTLKEVSAARVFESWKNSPSHNSLILELGVWKNINWPAMGIGVYENTATVWFGDIEDPIGDVEPCGNQSPGG
ncbi:MAG: CAP domain-containing protein [Nitrospirae bacterium]|nr:CAP domain-containing protein [Nitrospirota bacterium]